MPEDNDWGEVVRSDGSCVPLGPPEFTVPEDEREYLVNRPGLVLWTRRCPALDEQDTVGEFAIGWCVDCEAELPPPIRDAKAIQLCGECGREQPGTTGGTA